MASLRLSIAALALSALSTACDPSDVDSQGGAGAGGGDTGGAGGSGVGGSGSGVHDYESCLAAMKGIDAICADEMQGTIEWVGYGADRCMGSSGNAEGWARFSFSLDEVDPEGNPTVRWVNLEPPSDVAPQTADHVEITLDPPVKVTPTSPLPMTLTGSASIVPMVFAGGLAFVRGEGADATVTLDRALALDELLDGGVVTGTFTLLGGDFTKLDQNGEPVTAPDASARVEGCFVVPFELDAGEP